MLGRAIVAGGGSEQRPEEWSWPGAGRVPERKRAGQAGAPGCAGSARPCMWWGEAPRERLQPHAHGCCPEAREEPGVLPREEAAVGSGGRRGAPGTPQGQAGCSHSRIKKAWAAQQVTLGGRRPLYEGTGTARWAELVSVPHGAVTCRCQRLGGRGMCCPCARGTRGSGCRRAWCGGCEEQGGPVPTPALGSRPWGGPAPGCSRGLGTGSASCPPESWARALSPESGPWKVCLAAAAQTPYLLQHHPPEAEFTPTS